MKKLFMLLCIVIMFLGLVSCPSPDKSASKTSISSVATKPDSRFDTADGDKALPVYEPITFTMVGSGLVGLAAIGRKWFKK